MRVIFNELHPHSSLLHHFNKSLPLLFTWKNAHLIAITKCLHVFNNIKIFSFRPHRARQHDTATFSFRASDLRGGLIKSRGQHNIAFQLRDTESFHVRARKRSDHPGQLLFFTRSANFFFKHILVYIYYASPDYPVSPLSPPTAPAYPAAFSPSETWQTSWQSPLW